MTKKVKTVYVANCADGNGKEFDSEAEAQAYEIQQLPGIHGMLPDGWKAGEWVVANRDAILIILGARKRIRSDKGTKRKPQKNGMMNPTPLKAAFDALKTI